MPVPSVQFDAEVEALPKAVHFPAVNLGVELKFCESVIAQELQEPAFASVASPLRPAFQIEDLAQNRDAGATGVASGLAGQLLLGGEAAK